MYRIKKSKNFKKALRKYSQQKKFPTSDLVQVINNLKLGKTLDLKYKDHALKGALEGRRECHIRSDLLLVYKIQKRELLLSLLNLGSHSQLFK